MTYQFNVIDSGMIYRGLYNWKAWSGHLSVPNRMWDEIDGNTAAPVSTHFHLPSEQRHDYKSPFRKIKAILNLQEIVTSSY
jgi:hypothetical protein